jgi:hypothetical protein
MKMLIVLFLFLPFFQVDAHEGHNHAPGMKMAPHGGIVKESKTMHWEMVREGKEVKLFPYDIKMTHVKPEDLTVSAALVQPRKNLNNPLSLKVEGEAFMFDLVDTGSHRYELNVFFEKKIKSKDSKPDKVQFQIEPVD